VVRADLSRSGDGSRRASFAGYAPWKRLLDIVGSAGTLIVLSPVALGIAAAVWATMGRPILFTQTRPGRGGRLFTIYKFRTMREARDVVGAPLPDGARLTSFGRFLRATSLDELPELLNVLSGDMSLVGPRPLLPEYLPLYSPEQARRHEVRPGLTGWAQVNGRNGLGWKDRFAYDVFYVDHCNFFLDTRIVLLTVARVLRRQGIAQDGQATMEPFRGNVD